MSTQRVLASGLSWIDLLFRGRPNRIACAIVTGAGGTALVDPGPTSCLETLEASLAMHGQTLESVTHLLLTHIHLDHAGVTGVILRRHPQIQVVVHERGARHLVDPSKLLESATRLYGNAMDELWGEVAPVPERNLIVVRGGETVTAGGRAFAVAYTPGHASHHVSYFDASSGIAFVGDTGGVCVDGGYALPPTPPPDIDVELWEQSVGVIGAWNPSTLFLTHCGPVTNVPGAASDSCSGRLRWCRSRWRRRGRMTSARPAMRRAFVPNCAHTCPRNGQLPTNPPRDSA